MSAGRVECGLHEVRAGRSQQKRLSLARCPLVIPLVHHLMRAVVMYLALSSAVADAAPLKEVFVTPWFAYGTAVGLGACEESPDDSDRRDQRMSGGVEVLTTVSTRCRVASAIQVHRWAAIELAGGLQGDTGEFHGMRGIFGRVGLRLGPREPAN